MEGTEGRLMSPSRSRLRISVLPILANASRGEGCYPNQAGESTSITNRWAKVAPEPSFLLAGMIGPGGSTGLPV